MEEEGCLEDPKARSAPPPKDGTATGLRPPALRLDRKGPRQTFDSSKFKLRHYRWGDVALFVDNFATRDLKQTCTVDFPEGVADAYGALDYVATFAFVDRTRIAAVGYSQGADTALTIASGRLASAFVLPQGAKFKAAAAFYPPCALAPYHGDVEPRGRSGRSPHWLKIKNPKAPAVKREAEEDWGR